MSEPPCCPTCRRPFPAAASNDADDADDGAAAAAAMRAACAVMGLATTWDGYVSEADAARLMGRSPSTMRNRRSLDRPVPYRKRGRHVEYSLTDLARWDAESIQKIGD